MSIRGTIRIRGTMGSVVAFGLLAGATAATLSAQRPEAGSAAAGYAVVDAEAVALTGVTLIDGTGTPARTGQTVVIEGSRIGAVGPDEQVDIPAGAEVMDMSGHTVIPGMIGLHNHLFYTAAGGRSAQLTLTARRGCTWAAGSPPCARREAGSRTPNSTSAPRLRPGGRRDRASISPRRTSRRAGACRG